jgi:ubiquinone/menaquinone biosynthesis C-methylase UbiE
MVWLFLLGRERSYRERLLDLARVTPGQSVLDVGCGTGTLAIAAKRRAGPSGTVHGVDPSPEMIARARRKAAKAGLDVTFTVGTAEALPFPDAHFDTVLNTLVMHHLPEEVRPPFVRSIRRLLRRGGHALVVDYSRPASQGRSFLDLFHRHGHVDMAEIGALLRQAGLEVVESGTRGVRGQSFLVAKPDPRAP